MIQKFWKENIAFIKKKNQPLKFTHLDIHFNFISLFNKKNYWKNQSKPNPIKIEFMYL